MINDHICPPGFFLQDLATKWFASQKQVIFFSSPWFGMMSASWVHKRNVLRLGKIYESNYSNADIEVFLRVENLCWTSALSSLQQILDCVMMVVDAATANFRSSGTPYQLPANTNLYLLNLNDTTVFENNKKVSFNIASEASYVAWKKAKNGVTVKQTKIGGKC